MLKRAGIFFLYVVIILTPLFLSIGKVLSQSLLSQDDKIENSRFLNDPTDNIIFHLFPEEFNFRGIRCIYKDYKGLMWFGTQEGLVKFDGVNLKLYESNPKDPYSLCYNQVNTIVEDHDKNLYIGTSQGLNLYNRNQDNFSQIDLVNENTSIINNTYIGALFVDDKNYLWIGGYNNQLFSYNIGSKETNNYVNTPKKRENSGSFTIVAIVEDAGNLWIGTQSGLFFFHKESGKYKEFYHNPDDPNSLSSNIITSIQKDIYGQIWISTEDKGINLLIDKGGDFSFESYTTDSKEIQLSGNYIKRMYADNMGNLWIGTENDGLNILSIKEKKIKVYKNIPGDKKSISSNSIWGIFGDNEGRIWIGTYNRGINVVDVNISKIESYERNSWITQSLPQNDVRGFSETKLGKVWVATDGGGICRFDLESRIVDKVINVENQAFTISNNFVQTVMYDTIDRLWVGSWGGGVDLLTEEGVFIKNYRLENEQGIGNNRVRVLYQDLNGNIWAGTNGSGLFLYNSKIDHFVPVKPNNILSQRAYVVAIASDLDNTLWIGTPDGLTQLDFKETPDRYSARRFTTNNSSLSDNSIISISVDNSNNIWVGTSSGGVNQFNKEDESFKIFTKQEGLPSNNISGILDGDDDILWISTNAGLCMYNTRTNETKIFTKEDGLNSNYFYTQSCIKTKNGALLFGSEKGFNLFYPENIVVNKHIPNVLLTDLKIDNISIEIGGPTSPLKKQISLTDTLVLEHDQSSFAIDFVALNYTQPNKNQFCYKLEGFDKDWICVGNKKSAKYTKVSPGEYLFKVKGSNNDGLWNENPTTLKIIIKPPFWQTWWAYTLYIISLTSIFTLVYRSWKERLRIKNQLEVEKLAKEKEHELNERNIQFFTNISHEFRTPLSLITGPLESLINSSSSEDTEHLLVIQKNANRLLSLTNNLMDLRKLEEGGMRLKIQEEDILTCIKSVSDYFKVRFKRLNINFSIESQHETIIGWFDKEKFTTVLINLLSNAVKHTPVEGKIKIRVKNYNSTQKHTKFSQNFNYVTTESRMLEISVIDSGVGIEADDLPYVFDKFYQTSPGSEKRKYGTGIGLTLTKGLVELHNGKIWVESKPYYKTKFTFVIPIDKKAFGAGCKEEEASFNIEQKVYLDSIENEPDKKNISGIEDSNDKPKILIVEDNEDLRSFLSKELGKVYSVIEASDGDEGIIKAEKYIPDLIISDIMMPKKSGIELCKTIKSDIKTSHIPVVLLTAKTTTKDQIEGIDIGADAYITKPFSLTLLLTQANNLVNSRRELYAQFSQNVYIIPNKLTGNDLDQKFLQKTIDFIIQHIADTTLNVESLASFHNMSHSIVYKKIKALTGNTIIEFIKIVRLKQALTLMEQKKYSLSEISYMTGFTTPSYFSKNFKDQYGKTPSEYLN